MKVTILGCGTSGGVPRVGNIWGACDPENPRNRRRRASILIEDDETTILIDTSPDLREQLLDADVTRLDAVFFTHDHADHTHGIDDLRPIFHMMGSPVEIYADATTLSVLQRRFDYIFQSQSGYPAICTPNLLKGAVTVGSVTMQPFRQLHGPIESLGFRFSSYAYSTDLNGIPDKSFLTLEGVETWIVDALRYDPHPTHTHLAQTLEWIERVQPNQAILTHMTWDMDYDTLCETLPDHIRPAYDGMVLKNKS